MAHLQPLQPLLLTHRRVVPDGARRRQSTAPKARPRAWPPRAAIGGRWRRGGLGSAPRGGGGCGQRARGGWAPGAGSAAQRMRGVAGRAAADRFLIALSVRPGMSFTILDQRVPYRATDSMMMRSSSVLHEPFLTSGQRWLNHLRTRRESVGSAGHTCGGPAPTGLRAAGRAEGGGGAQQAWYVGALSARAASGGVPPGGSGEAASLTSHGTACRRARADRQPRRTSGRRRWSGRSR